MIRCRIKEMAPAGGILLIPPRGKLKEIISLVLRDVNR